MTREKAIRQLEGVEMLLLNRRVKPFRQAMLMAIAALREQGNCCKNGNSSWISVEDRLPEPGQMVLVYCRSQMHKAHITVSTYKADYSYTRGCYWSRRVKKVTHWMPLPEPPEVEV